VGLSSAVAEGSGIFQSQDSITFYESANITVNGTPEPGYGANLFSQPGIRPTASAGDCAISVDGSTFSGSNGLALRCQNSISNYINSLPNGSSWLEQLAPSGKSLAVPLVLSNGTQTTTNTFTISVATLTTPRALAINDPGGPASIGLSLGLAAIAGPTSQINAGMCASQTGTINNVTSSANTLIVTPQSSMFAAGYLHLTVDAYVSSASTVTLEVCNPTANNITPGAITFNVRAF